MNLQQIETEALTLPEEERAALAQKLILSLDPSGNTDLTDEWLAEAMRRAVELDNGTVKAIPADEVREKAKALLR